MIRKRLIMLGMLGFGALALGTSSGQQNSKLAAQKGWHNNLANATALARKTGKPLMVVLRCDP